MSEGNQLVSMMNVVNLHKSLDPSIALIRNTNLSMSWYGNKTSMIKPELNGK